LTEAHAARAVRSNLTESGWLIAALAATLIHPDYVFNLYANKMQIQRQRARERCALTAVAASAAGRISKGLVQFVSRLHSSPVSIIAACIAATNEIYAYTAVITDPLPVPFQCMIIIDFPVAESCDTYTFETISLYTTCTSYHIRNFISIAITNRTLSPNFSDGQIPGIRQTLPRH